jgi:hypothetical protein
VEFTHLGRTGLTVSRIGLGALKAAAPENLPGAHALMDRALEHGINYLDTANQGALTRGNMTKGPNACTRSDPSRLWRLAGAQALLGGLCLIQPVTPAYGGVRG